MMKKTEIVFQLNNLPQLLPFEPVYWREMYEFSQDCILSYFCDELYNFADYIYTPYHNTTNYHFRAL